MIIAIGSTQKDKIAATQAAVALVPWLAGTTVIPVGGIDSGVPPQPIGTETRSGAYNRAIGALSSTMSADVGLGIENGIDISRGATSYDFASIILVYKYSKFARRKFVRVDSIYVPMPDEDVNASIDSNGQKTAGAFLAERTGCDPADPHAYLTGGLLPRAKILEQAILTALAIAFPKP